MHTLAHDVEVLQQIHKLLHMGSSHFPTQLSHQFCSKLFQFSENCEKFAHYSVKPSAHDLGLESMPSAAPYTNWYVVVVTSSKRQIIFVCRVVSQGSHCLCNQSSFAQDYPKP
jgi:hypothetical protein